MFAANPRVFSGDPIFSANSSDPLSPSNNNNNNNKLLFSTTNYYMYTGYNKINGYNDIVVLKVS